MPTYPLKKLSEILKIQNGYAFDSKSFNFEKGVPLIRIRDLKNGLTTETKYLGNYPKEYEVNSGDFLIGMDGEFRCYEWKGKTALLNQRVCRLHSFSKALNSKYLFYSINKYLKDIEDVTGFTTVKHISSRQIGEIEIPLPPLSVQEEIVAKLDAALASIDEAKTKTEQALAATRELWESTLEEAFRENNTGEVKKLGELGQITSSKRIYKKEYVKNGIPFYRIKEIKELAHEKAISIELYISKDRYNEIKETFGIPQEGDLLMTAVGTIGEIYTVKKDDIFYFKDGNVLWFRKFNSINPHFLKLILLSFVENIKKLSIGSAYNALTIEKLENYTISIPSLPEQSRIVAHLDAVRIETDRLASLYEQKLADLNELRRSVLQEAFA